MKKYLSSYHVDGKREIACFHVETTTDKRENGGKIVVTWSFGHVVTLCCLPTPEAFNHRMQTQDQDTFNGTLTPHGTLTLFLYI